MAKQDSDQYRKGVVKRFAMTEDEQTWCWELLNDVQIAVNNRDSVQCDALVKKIERRLTKLRTPEGQAWMLAQRLEDLDE